MCKDNCKTSREPFKFWDFVHLIWESLQYTISSLWFKLIDLSLFLRVGSLAWGKSHDYIIWKNMNEIDQSHKSHIAPIPYLKIHHSEQKCAHFCSEWCIVGYGISALWVCEVRLFTRNKFQQNKNKCKPWWLSMHYNDVVTGMMASQISSLTIVYSTIYSGVDQRKHQSSASLAFVQGIHQWPVNSLHKCPVTPKKNVIVYGMHWAWLTISYLVALHIFKTLQYYFIK